LYHALRLYPAMRCIRQAAHIDVTQMGAQATEASRLGPRRHYDT
jgi:hypothetical protein